MTGMVRATEVAPAWVTDFYADIDTMDLEKVLDHMADDIWARHHTDPPVEGKDNYREYAKRFYSRHTKLEHKIIQAWETEDGMAIVELLATHTLTDGRSPSTPAMSQITRRDGKIVRIKAFLDKSPFLPPSQ